MTGEPPLQPYNCLHKPIVCGLVYSSILVIGCNYTARFPSHVTLHSGSVTAIRPEPGSHLIITLYVNPCQYNKNHSSEYRGGAKNVVYMKSTSVDNFYHVWYSESIANVLDIYTDVPSSQQEVLAPFFCLFLGQSDCLISLQM
jgi:hypothetical protein